MIDGFRVYDTHTHIGRAWHSGRVQSAGQLIESMDAVGIDRSVAFPFPVVEDYRREHDEIGQALRQYPDRLRGAACLSPYVPEQEYRDEIRRCVEEWGFCAIKLQPQYQALNPLSSRCDFLWECAMRHGLAVIVHTGSGVPFALPSLYIHPARKFPEVRIILGHAGGSVYALETIVAAEVCPNIYIELSSLMPHHILEILRHVPSNRLLAGSDLPESASIEMGKIVGLPVNDREKHAILWETAESLFG